MTTAETSDIPNATNNLNVDYMYITSVINHIKWQYLISDAAGDPPNKIIRACSIIQNIRESIEGRNPQNHNNGKKEIKI